MYEQKHVTYFRKDIYTNLLDVDGGDDGVKGQLFLTYLELPGKRYIGFPDWSPDPSDDEEGDESKDISTLVEHTKRTKADISSEDASGVVQTLPKPIPHFCPKAIHQKIYKVTFDDDTGEQEVFFDHDATSLLLGIGKLGDDPKQMMEDV